MADPHKTRTGQQVEVRFEGVTHRGAFGGIIPPNPRGKTVRDRQEKVIVRNGDRVHYVPLVEGTIFKIDRRQNAAG